MRKISLFNKLFKKRGIFASFFLFFSFLCQGQNAKFNQPVSDDQLARFSSLLHISNNIRYVQDSTFYFSKDKSVISELTANISQLNNTEYDFICQFPARAYWLNNTFKLKKDLNFENCPELNQYLTATNVSNISLIFASENIISPSSFMGHSFLKLSDQSGALNHAVSYFTDIEGVNIPKIMYDAMVTGKEGYFLVSPYSESEFFYGNVESRNIFDYQLKLSDEEVLLIVLHLWELRNKQIDYFFHTHNCATLTLAIMAIIRPEMIQELSQWLTPVDIVKITQQYDLINQTTITPSTKWEVRAYGSDIKNDQKNQYFNSVLNGTLNILQFDNANPSVVYTHLNYLKALNDFSLDNKLISDVMWQDNRLVIEELLSHYENYVVDFSSFKNPLLRQPDSQLAFGYSHYTANAIDSLSVRWLPVSHTLFDNNTNMFSESSLKLLETTVSVDDQKNINIDKFTLYSIEQYLEFDPVIHGYSGYFDISYIGRNNFTGEIIHDGNVAFGLGLSTKPHDALMLYTTLGANVGFNLNKAWLAPKVSVGFFSYLKNNSKLNMSYDYQLDPHGSSEHVQTFNLSNSYFIANKYALLFKYQWNKIEESNSNFKVEFNYYY